jgi:hypothetical protein
MKLNIRLDCEGNSFHDKDHFGWYDGCTDITKEEWKVYQDLINKVSSIESNWISNMSQRPYKENVKWIGE